MVAGVVAGGGGVAAEAVGVGGALCVTGESAGCRGGVAEGGNG